MFVLIYLFILLPYYIFSLRLLFIFLSYHLVLYYIIFPFLSLFPLLPLSSPSFYQFLLSYHFVTYYIMNSSLLKLSPFIFLSFLLFVNLWILFAEILLSILLVIHFWNMLCARERKCKIISLIDSHYLFSISAITITVTIISNSVICIVTLATVKLPTSSLSVLQLRIQFP